MAEPFLFFMSIQRFMRFFFDLLYHQFAFTYDLVAGVVSFGQWKKWGQSIIPYIDGKHVLELGHGPGHLQRFLLERGLTVFALDESAQMGHLAKKRIGESQKLSRAIAQHLPYRADAFESVIATFPTEYIFSPQTLSEINRVLRSNGRLVILPAAWPKSPLLKWLFRVTGENPSALNDVLIARFSKPVQLAGFKTDIQTIEVKSDMILIIVAQKQ